MPYFSSSVDTSGRKRATGDPLDFLGLSRFLWGWGPKGHKGWSQAGPKYAFIMIHYMPKNCKAIYVGQTLLLVKCVLSALERRRRKPLWESCPAVLSAISTITAFHLIGQYWSAAKACFYNSSSNNYCCWWWCAKINLWKMKIVEPEHPGFLSCHNTSNQSNVCDNHRMTMLMQLMMMMMKQANQISPQSIGDDRLLPQWQVSLQLSITFKIFACC